METETQKQETIINKPRQKHGKRNRETEAQKHK